jgi:hypothetical protein
MTGQLPLAIAQLLIERIPALRSMSNNDVTAMVPALHTHTDTSLALGNQQDPIFILVQISIHASRAFPAPVLLFPLRADVQARAGGPRRGVPRWAAPRASAPGPQVGFLRARSRSCVRARAGGVEATRSSKIALSSSASESPS